MGRKTTVLLVDAGEDTEYFCTASEFMFNPPICTMAAPKVENVFLRRGLDKCIRICQERGWRYSVHEMETPSAT